MMLAEFFCVCKKLLLAPTPKNLNLFMTPIALVKRSRAWTTIFREKQAIASQIRQKHN